MCGDLYIDIRLVVIWLVVNIITINIIGGNTWTSTSRSALSKSYLVLYDIASDGSGSKLAVCSSYGIYTSTSGQ